MTDFRNKVVLITGGSSGIGLALAFAFGQEGAKVIISARNEVKLQAAIVQLQLAHITAIGIAADVTSQVSCQELVSKSVTLYGHLDVLVNNAGISMRAMFQDLDMVVLEQLMATNFWGSVYCTKAALPHLLASRGHIVSISSIAGLRGLPGRTGYSASKAALQGFMEALRVELLKTGVHVLMVYPGYTSSNIRNAALDKSGNTQPENPLDESKLMPAEVVAKAVVDATAVRKRDLILTKQGKLTVWLNKFIPGVMDRMVYNFMKGEGDLR